MFIYTTAKFSSPFPDDPLRYLLDSARFTTSPILPFKGPKNGLAAATDVYKVTVIFAHRLYGTVAHRRTANYAYVRYALEGVLEAA